MSKLLVLPLIAWSVFAQTPGKEPIPEQAKRGKEFFAKVPKGTACATCHAIEGIGVAVGPDLTRLAKLAGPKGLFLSINMTQTAYLQTAKVLKREFPVMVKAKNGDVIELWDLSANPPLLNKFKTVEVEMLRFGAKWQHPPTAAAYSDAQLADVVAYLKWVANGETKPIKPADFH